jgi:hypothetical protein
MIDDDENPGVGAFTVNPHLEYIQSRSELFIIPAAPGVSVGWVYTLLKSKKRDRYKISGGGSGCRWWM